MTRTIFTLDMVLLTHWMCTSIFSVHPLRNILLNFNSNIGNMYWYALFDGLNEYIHEFFSYYIQLLYYFTFVYWKRISYIVPSWCFIARNTLMQKGSSIKSLKINKNERKHDLRKVILVTYTNEQTHATVYRLVLTITK